jgi:DNA (cytosine-5)-methyltransferase 1
VHVNVLDLFSGIGGFSLGLERAGMRTIGFCEISPFCRSVLAKHWPAVPCFPDIRTLDANRLAQLGRIDLICGGFPCQPYSVAGAQKGKADDRDLWPEMFRIVSLVRPTWIIGENVTGLIGMALDAVLADLESIGYTTRPFVIPAAGLGAPHRRYRLWFVATSYTNSQSIRIDKQRQARRRNHVSDGREAEPGNNGDARDVYSHTDRGRREIERVSQLARLESEEGCVSDRLRALRQLHDAATADDATDASGTGLSIPERAKLQRSRRRKEGRATTERSWWTAQPGVCGVAYGVRNRVDRLRALGNSLVPQIPEIIGRAIMSAESARGRSGHADRADMR